MYCKECGKEINDKAIVCPNCGCSTKHNTFSTERNKWIALLLWFFLGGLGAHRFYVKDNNGGAMYIALLILGTITLGLLYIPLVILWIIDLIKILQGELNGVELEG